MLKEGQKIEIEWKKQNKKHYEQMGYRFTKYGDSFEIKIEDVPDNNKTRIKVVCDACGKESEMKATSYVANVKRNGMFICASCKSKMAAERTLGDRSEKAYKMFLELCHKKGYEPISAQDDIVNNESLLFYRCKKHGLQAISVYSVKQGYGCPKCGAEIAVQRAHETTLSKRQDSLYNRALTVAKAKGYDLLTDKREILNNCTYIEYRCPIHGNHSMRIKNLINGRGCPECAHDTRKKKISMDTESVAKRISECGGELLNAQDYINCVEKNLLVKCPKCGKPFITSLRIFTQHGGQLCDDCHSNESVGAIRIHDFLDSNNILYEQEKWFADCRDTKPLPFDFYLPDYNVCIEFDGRQHFEDTGYFTYSFEETQAHDKIKNKYCADKGIGLIRIPYKKINHISEVLTAELNLHKDMT